MTVSETDRPTVVVPYLSVRGGVEALAFYRRGFGAVEVLRWLSEDGRVSHAEFTVGGARFFLADEWPEMHVLSPATLGGYSVSLVIDVADAAALVDRLAAEGATVERPVAPGPTAGTVAGWVIDPYGHRWHISSPAPA